MNHRKTRNCCKQKRFQKRIRKGSVVTEMALTISLLFFLAFSSYELCRANMIRHTVEAACYEGARQGILPGANVEQINDGVNFVLSSINARDAAIVVTSSQLPNNTEEVEVEITLPLNSNLTFAPFLFKDAVIVRRCKMVKEELL